MPRYGGVTMWQRHSRSRATSVKLQSAVREPRELLPGGVSSGFWIGWGRYRAEFVVPWTEFGRRFRYSVEVVIRLSYAFDTQM